MPIRTGFLVALASVLVCTLGASAEINTTETSVKPPRSRSGGSGVGHNVKTISQKEIKEEAQNQPMARLSDKPIPQTSTKSVTRTPRSRSGGSGIAHSRTQ